MSPRCNSHRWAQPVLPIRILTVEYWTIPETWRVLDDIINKHTLTTGIIPGAPTGTRPAAIACICKFFSIKLFLPFCSNCSLKCCGGCKYLHGGSFRWHFPWKYIKMHKDKFHDYNRRVLWFPIMRKRGTQATRNRYIMKKNHLI